MTDRAARPSALKRAARRVVRKLPRPIRKAVRAAARDGVLPGRIKVSVIIAAYNSDPAGLERVMSSLATQSMDPREVEVIFVDDGSTDDTRSRLDALARTRPNVVVKTIPNSGWASRPRNVGIELARGHYLLFMDHDDELFPDALQWAYDYGRRHRADVVNAKEVRTDGWSWGWDSFTADIAQVERLDPNPLDPMRPHKLYRRSFVLDKRLLFPEGKRVLWEDIYFNTMAYARGARVAILSQRGFYRWVAGEQNTYYTFERDAAEYWSKLTGLLAFIDTELAGKSGRQPLLTHQVRGLVLGFIGPKSLSRPDSYYEVAYRYVQDLVAGYAPPHLDADLPSVDRCRVELVRLGRADLQRRLAEHDLGVTAVPVLDRVEWDGPEMVLSISTTLVDSQGAAVRFRRTGDRWSRVLPGDLTDVLSSEAPDVTRDLDQASLAMSVKGRNSGFTWQLAGAGTVSCTDDGTGFGIVTGTLTARFDPVAFAAEHHLADPVWDFAARFAATGYGAHRGLRGGRSVVALLGGVAAVGYVNRGGLYSLDVAAAVRTVTGSAGVSTDARLHTAAHRDGVHVEATLPLPSVHCAGATRLVGQVLIGSEVRAVATLEADQGQAVLKFSAVVPEGDHTLRTRFLDRTGNTGLVLSTAAGTAHVATKKPQ